MKAFTLKNCLTSIISITCLTLLAIILLIFIFIRNISLKNSNYSINNNSLSNKEKQKLLEKTNMTPKDGVVVSRIGIISDTENDWGKIEEAITYLDNRTDLIIHLGDITKLGEKEDFYKAYEVFEKSKVKIYAIPGDRDLWKSRRTEDSSTSVFNEVFGNNYQVLESQDINILLVDNANIYEGIDSIQWQFINNNIPNIDFVFLHNPLYFNSNLFVGDKGMGQYSNDVDMQRNDLLSLIRENKVKAVFAGNQHLFSETVDSEKPDLFHYVIGALTSSRSIGLPSFAILTIYQNGDYFVEKITI
jgi:CMP-N-acetylneuraminic acid synthetase